MANVGDFKERLEKGETVDLPVRRISVQVDARELDENKVTILFLSYQEAAYLMEGILSNTLTLQVRKKDE